MKFLLLACVLLLSACSVLSPSYKTDPNGVIENSKAGEKSPYVIMISLDGFRHDYIKRYAPPFLSSVKKKGVHAKKLYSIFPSKTFPNHYSLATGLYAKNHGIVANRFYDPKKDKSYRLGDNSTTQDGTWYNGSPLWLSVRDQGLLSASYFWVGSDANIKGHYPNYYLPYNQSNPGEDRVAQIVDWLKLPPAKRPHLLQLYFHYVDSAGHRYGPESNQVRDAIMKVDALISTLYKEVQSLKLPVSFVIVSDHGMMNIKSDGSLFLGKLYDKKEVYFEGKGPISIGYVKNKKNIQRIERALAKTKGMTVYTQKTLPKRFHYNGPRTGDLILSAEPGYYIYPNKRDGRAASGATHGYDPIKTDEMGGLFLAFGAGVNSKGEIPPFENIHVYPFVMNLLGLEVKKKIDGRREVLAPYLAK